MKKIILFLTVIFSLFSCQKEPTEFRDLYITYELTDTLGNQVEIDSSAASMSYNVHINKLTDEHIVNPIDDSFHHLTENPKEIYLGSYGYGDKVKVYYTLNDTNLILNLYVKWGTEDIYVLKSNHFFEFLLN